MSASPPTPASFCVRPPPPAVCWQPPRPGAAEPAFVIPPPALDQPAAAAPQKAVVAGGCFWGVQGVFQHVKGVTSAVSGYAGGQAGTANYDTVSGGRSGHAEAVQVSYDPSQVSYGQLLQVFFSVVHDPTQLNRQGPTPGRSTGPPSFLGRQPAQGGRGLYRAAEPGRRSSCWRWPPR